MIDSETPKTSAERKAALRRQQALLREDIENLNARAVHQVCPVQTESNTFVLLTSTIVMRFYHATGNNKVMSYW